MPSDTLQLYYQLWLVRDGLLGPTPLFTDPVPVPDERAPREPHPDVPAAGAALHRPLGVRPSCRLQPARPALLPRDRPRRLRTRPPAHRHAAAALVGGRRLRAASGAARPPVRRPSRPASRWPSCRRCSGVSTWRSREGGSPAASAAGLALLALAMLEPQYTYTRWGSWRRARRDARPGRATGARGRGAARRVRALSWRPPVGWVLMLRQAFVAGSIAEAGRRHPEVRLFSPGPRILAQPPRMAGPCSPCSPCRPRGAGARRRRRSSAPLRGGARVGPRADPGPDAPEAPALRGAPPLAPVLRDDPQPEKARAPRTPWARSSWRPLAPAPS